MGSFLKARMRSANQGMTLMEVLIVISLISMVSLALYNALNNGIKIWTRTQSMILEEDIAIFFDKLNHDVRNLIVSSKFQFEGTEHRLKFPTIVRVPADINSSWPKEEYIDQIGVVEYYYELYDNQIFKRTANYPKALDQVFGEPVPLAHPIDDIKFRYIYLTDNDEIISDEALNKIPHTIEVEVTFTDRQGQKIMKKFIDVPLGATI